VNLEHIKRQWRSLSAQRILHKVRTSETGDEDLRFNIGFLCQVNSCLLFPTFNKSTKHTNESYRP
jgi:hypothetical protein